MTAGSLSRRRPTEVMPLDGAKFIIADRMTPPMKTATLTMWLFILALALFGGLGTWAAIAPMRSAVIATGIFGVLGDRLVVQHLEGGIVREILVKDGDTVREGQVIARLDSTRADASVSILLNQLASKLTADARLAAEFQNAPTIALSDELKLLLAQNPDFADLLRAQQDIFETKVGLYQGQIEILQDRVSQLQEQHTGAKHRSTTLEAQLVLVKDKLLSITKLYEDQLTTKSRYLDVRREEAAIIGEIAIAESNRQLILEQIAELEERKLQLRRDQLMEITKERESVSESIYDIRQRIEAATEMRERITIRAPRAGKIVGLSVNTLGAVVDPGQSIAEIVPDTDDYIIDAVITPNDIDQVHEGGEARVRLTAYNFRTTPIVMGDVTYVSPDSFVDEKTGALYFRASITLRQGELAHLRDIEVVPGMAAQVMITTGEQTLADYLLDPIRGGLEVSLSENNS